MNYIKTYSILVIILSSLNSIGQTKTKNIKVGDFELQSSTVDSSISTLYYSHGKMPEFPGGLDSLAVYAKQRLYYPQSAIQDSIQGQVMIEFTIGTSGKVIDEKLHKSVRSDLDTLCISMVKQMPTWRAGHLEGKAVAVRFVWPIKFTL